MKKELNRTFQFAAGGAASGRRIASVLRGGKGRYGPALGQLYYNGIASKIDGGWKPLLGMVKLYADYMRAQKPVKLKINAAKRREING